MLGDLGEDLMKIFDEFYERDNFHKGINATFIVLFPKMEGAKDLSNFKPITLVDNLYKIIAKVLSIRLRSVIVSIFEGVFVKE